MMVVFSSSHWSPPFCLFLHLMIVLIWSPRSLFLSLSLSHTLFLPLLACPPLCLLLVLVFGSCLFFPLSLYFSLCPCLRVLAYRSSKPGSCYCICLHFIPVVVPGLKVSSGGKVNTMICFFTLTQSMRDSLMAFLLSPLFPSCSPSSASTKVSDGRYFFVISLLFNSLIDSPRARWLKKAMLSYGDVARHSSFTKFNTDINQAKTNNHNSCRLGAFTWSFTYIFHLASKPRSHELKHLK